MNERRVVRVLAPAKVNLFLGVGASRPDGYHDVVTVLHALELADELTVEPAGELALACDTDLGIEPERNLAWRAAIALAEELDTEPRVAIGLRKRIPHGAGLGGGSSDAAAVLLGMCELWGVLPDDPRVLRAARSLGADVPFFLGGGPAVMTGRGDVLERRLPGLVTPVLLVKGAASAPTAAVYEQFDRDPHTSHASADVTRALADGDVRLLAASLVNDLAAPSAQVVPGVADALAWCRLSAGVLGAQVAGSGSAVFALCDSDSTAADLASRAAEEGFWSAATRLRPGGARVLEGADA